MDSKIKCILLRVHREGNAPDVSTEIFGRSLDQWVQATMRNFELETVDYSEADDILPYIQPLINEQKQMTVVLYSDTPLISYDSVHDGICQIISDGLSMVRMPRGWIFKTDYLKSLKEVPDTNTYYYGDDDYVTVYNYNQLAYVTDILRARISHYFMSKGVKIIDPNSTLIGSDVIIEPNVTIEPFNIIKGKTLIKSGAIIGSNCEIDSSVISSGAVVRHSVITSSVVGCDCTVGPFANLRSGSVLGRGVHIGDYVEIKGSKIGEGSKIGHHAYVGDAEVGSQCNISAGVIFANYDGASKHKTVLGDNVFVGSNSTLIAPLSIGSGAFIAGGSTITDDVDNDALAIAREKQIAKNNWIKNPYKKDKRS